MATANKQRARLSIDIEPELRRRIKIAAAARDLSLREYVETLLRRALDAEMQASNPLGSHMTPEERARGLRALTALERLDRELLERRRGEPFSPSWELLNEARDARTHALLDDV